jgi:hypothetical protein
MSSKLLQDAGQALYGPRWQTDLARDLDVADRTMRRWLAGDDMPPGVAMDLWRKCEERIVDLQAIIDRLKTAATP